MTAVLNLEAVTHWITIIETQWFQWLKTTITIIKKINRRWRILYKLLFCLYLWSFSLVSCQITLLSSKSTTESLKFYTVFCFDFQSLRLYKLGYRRMTALLTVMNLEAVIHWITILKTQWFQWVKTTITIIKKNK